MRRWRIGRSTDARASDARISRDVVEWRGVSGRGAATRRDAPEETRGEEDAEICERESPIDDVDGGRAREKEGEEAGLVERGRPRSWDASGEIDDALGAHAGGVDGEEGDPVWVGETVEEEWKGHDDDDGDDVWTERSVDVGHEHVVQTHVEASPKRRKRRRRRRPKFEDIARDDLTLEHGERVMEVKNERGTGPDGGGVRPSEREFSGCTESFVDRRRKRSARETEKRVPRERIHHLQRRVR